MYNHDDSASDAIHNVFFYICSLRNDLNDAVVDICFESFQNYQKLSLYKYLLIDKIVVKHSLRFQNINESIENREIHASIQSKKIKAQKFVNFQTNVNKSDRFDDVET